MFDTERHGRWTQWSPCRDHVGFGRSTLPCSAPILCHQWAHCGHEPETRIGPSPRFRCSGSDYKGWAILGSNLIPYNVALLDTSRQSSPDLRKYDCLSATTSRHKGR